MYFLPYVLRSERPQRHFDVAKWYILRRMVNGCPAAKTRFRAVVYFLPYVLRSERTAGALLCRQVVYSAQDGERVPGGQNEAQSAGGYKTRRIEKIV